MRLTLDQQAELQKELKSGGSSKERKVEGVSLTDASLSLRVPSNTPYARVQGLLLSAAQAGIHRTEFAVASKDEKAEQRLAVPLPVPTAKVPKDADAPPAMEEIRVGLFWDDANKKTIRQFGTTRIRDDKQLRELIREGYAGWMRLGKPETPGCIDAARGVPWSAVVEAIDAFRAAGMENIQFAAGKPGK